MAGNHQAPETLSELERLKSNAKITGFFIPENARDWRKLYKMANLENKSIQALEYMQSASEVTDQQFTSLRVLWPRPKTPENFLKQLTAYGLDEAYEEAGNILSESEEFGRYLEMVQKGRRVQELKGEKDPEWPGSWKSVRSLQEQAIYDWSTEQAIASKAHRQGSSENELYGNFETSARHYQETKKRPASSMAHSGAEDESVVNSALILHLEAASDLLLTNQPNTCEWVLNRVDLGARFRPGKYGGYTARVDGVLWTKRLHEVLAIVETKRRPRTSTFEATMKQQSAQMAGWIKRSRKCLLGFGGHRLLIAEDCDEIWFTFGSWTKTYTEYLLRAARRRMDTVPRDAFLRMQPIGPWYLEDAGNVFECTRLFLAISIVADRTVME